MIDLDIEHSQVPSVQPRHEAPCALAAAAAVTGGRRQKYKCNIFIQYKYVSYKIHAPLWCIFIPWCAAKVLSADPVFRTAMFLLILILRSRYTHTLINPYIMYASWHGHHMAEIQIGREQMRGMWNVAHSTHIHTYIHDTFSRFIHTHTQPRGASQSVASRPAEHRTRTRTRTLATFRLRPAAPPRPLHLDICIYIWLAAG
jgi:hypothetical protein